MKPETTRDRRWLYGLLLILVLAWAAALAALPFAPARIPTHWGMDGQPDAYMSRVPGMLSLPATTTLISLVLIVLPRIDPRRHNYASFAKTYRFLQLMVALFMFGLQLVTIAAAFGSSVNITRLMDVGAGVLFVVVGNVLGKLRPTWFVGIRTPWTLSSSEVWTKTHRLGGRLLVLVGIVQIVVGFLLPARLSVTVLLVGILGWAAFLFMYSYWLWRRLNGGEQHEHA